MKVRREGRRGVESKRERERGKDAIDKSSGKVGLKNLSLYRVSLEKKNTD
jgi:hypothetical protein